MTRTLLPILLILAALGLFVLYTNPTYQKIKALSAQHEQYNAALAQSSQVRSVRDELLARRNTFSTDNVKKLQLLLPDNVDNIRLIIDINDIAARYHLQVTNVSLSGTGGASANSSVGTATGAVGTVELGFSITAGYSDFLAFLQDLERSLRLVDVESIKFTSGPADSNTYTLEIQTYWLR